MIGKRMVSACSSQHGRCFPSPSVDTAEPEFDLLATYPLVIDVSLLDLQVFRSLAFFPFEGLSCSSSPSELDSGFCFSLLAAGLAFCATIGLLLLLHLGHRGTRTVR